MPGVFGDVGVNDRTSHVSIHFDEILRHTDFVTALEGEAHRGRFGVLGGFLYLSASDGIGTNGLVSKLDFRVDQYLADLALSWRVIDTPRGWLDLLVGTRYVNIYQRLDVHPDDAAINRASERLVDALSERIKDRLLNQLSEGRFREQVRSAIGDRIMSRLEALEGRDPPLPVGPLGGKIPEKMRDRLEKIIEEKAREIAARLRNGAQLTEAEVRRRVNAAQEDLEKRISRALKRELSRSASKGNDWFDPYIGLRGRYQLSDAFYLIARGDIGGFGIGSDLTGQVYGAVGCQLSRNIYAEAGYRCLFIDYRKDGLIYDVATQGVQITVGINF